MEPLAPLLGFGLLLILLSQKRRVGGWWKAIKQVVLPNRLTVLYFLLITVLLVSFFYGYFLTGSSSLGSFLRLIKYFLYFLPFPLAIYAGKFLGRQNVNTVLVFVILIGITTAIFSLIRIFSFIQLGGQIDFWVYNIYNRSVGALGQFFDPFSFTIGLTGKAAHGTYGLYATVVLAVCLVVTSRFKEFTVRWFTFFTMGAFIFYASILYTLSRGAVVAAGLVFAGWFALMLKAKKVRVVAFTIVFLLISSIVLIWANPQVYQKFASTIKFLPTPSGQTSSSSAWGDEWEVSLDPSSGGRLERWEMIATFLKEKPVFAIFGVGYSTENLKSFTGVSSTHSLFLDLWARGGVLALLLVVAVWILIFGTIFRFLFSQDSEVRTFGYLLGAFATGWLLDNLISGEQFFSDAPMIAFWGVLGLVTALAQVESKKYKVKKILISLTSSDVGGAPKVVYDLLEQISKQKANETALAVKRAKRVSKRQKVDFEFIVAGPPGSFLREFEKLGYKTYSVRLDEISFKSFKNFLKIARKEEADLINSHGKGAGFYARIAGAIMGIPVVQTFHGLHYGYRNPLVRSLYLWLERFLTLFTKFVINVSRSQEREGVKMGIFPKNKSRVVVNGIDVRGFDKIKISRTNFRAKIGLRPKDFAVAVVARFDDVKGHARLINLIPDLVRAVPNLKVLFAGGGEGQARARTRVRELGVRSSVTFLGERDDVLKILKASDALVLPSFHEGMPLVPLEAAAASRPVIGSNVVGIKDVVQDGKTGFLVDFNKKSEAVKAFRKLAKSPALRRKMGEKGRRFVEKRFSIKKFVEGTLKVYKEALAG